MSKLLTVRLEDDQYEALQKTAGKRGMSAFVRSALSQPVSAVAGATHEACDQRIAELESDVRSATAALVSSRQQNEPMFGLLKEITDSWSADGQTWVMSDEVMERVRSYVSAEEPF
jgi:hypothetical protein